MAYFPAKVTDYGDNFYGIEISMQTNYSIKYPAPSTFSQTYDLYVLAPGKNLSLDDYNVLIPNISLNMANHIMSNYPSWQERWSDTVIYSFKNIQVQKGSKKSEIVVTYPIVEASVNAPTVNAPAVSYMWPLNFVFYLRRKK